MTLPLVALVLVGILAVARIGTERVLTQIAAREGARTAVVAGGLAASSDAARSVFPDGDADVDVREDRDGGVVEVTVLRRVRVRIPLIGALLPEAVELRGSASMRLER